MKTRIHIFGLLTLFILSFFSNRAFSQKNWTWYIESTHIESGYIEATISIKADSASEEGDLGNFDLIGTMSDDLYDFKEETGKNPTAELLISGFHFYTFDSLANYTGFYDWNLEVTLSSWPEKVTEVGISVAKLKFYIKNSDGSADIILNSEGDYQHTYEFTGPDPSNPDPENDFDLANVSYDSTGGDASLPVQMASLIATASQENGITVLWRTESETNCAGFHVWRSETEEGLYDCITTEMIAGQGNQSSATEYLFVDQHVADDVVYWYKVEEISTDGESQFFGPISVVGVSPVPKTFNLSSNYPNPFNPKTRFDYQIPDMCDVFISIYSILGQEIKTWIFENQEKGYYSLEWDGKDGRGKNVPSGVYLLRMQTAEFSKMRRMTVIR